MSTVVIHSFATAEKVIEQKDGRVSVIGMFTSITVNQRKIGPSWILFVEMSGVQEGRTYKAKIAVQKYGEDVTPVCTIEGELVPSDVSEHDTSIFYPVIPSAEYPSDGPYEVSLHIDGKKAASRTLRIIYV